MIAARHVAAMASGCMDTLPHNGAVISLLAICKLTHRESYKFIFVNTVAFPMMALAVVWFGDSGAYFGGKAMGRHKLYPIVSPNKTWEGTISGLAASVLGAYIIHLLLLPDLSLQIVVIAALVGGAVAQVGDLVESAFKRACGVKDSGQILPGHGGMLDRLDGLLFSAPVFAVLL